MSKLVDILVWVCVGANLAFIATMEAMSGVLASDGAVLNAAQVAHERTNFFNFQTTAFIAMIVIGAVSLFLRRQRTTVSNG